MNKDLERIADSLERIATVLEGGPLHINIDQGDLQVHNHSF